MSNIERTCVDALAVINWSRNNKIPHKNYGDNLISVSDLYRSKIFDQDTRNRTDAALELLKNLSLAIQGPNPHSDGPDKIVRIGRPRRYLLIINISDDEFAKLVAQTSPADGANTTIEPAQAASNTGDSPARPIGLVDSTSSDSPTASEVQPKGPTYYDVPSELKAELARFTEEEQQDIIDCWHLWRWAVDNLEPIDRGAETLKRAFENSEDALLSPSPSYNGRRFKLSNASENSTRFRKSPYSRVMSAVEYMERRGGICIGPLLTDLRNEAICTFYEEVLPTDLWEQSSPTRSLYFLTFEKAHQRFIHKITAKPNLEPVPTSLVPPLPDKITIVQDVKLCTPFQQGVTCYRRGQVIRERSEIAWLIKYRDIVPFKVNDEELPVIFCPGCSAPADIPSVDEREGIHAYIALRDFVAIYPITRTIRKDTVIIDEPMVLWLNQHEECFPIKPIKGHQFVTCPNQNCWLIYPIDELVSIARNT